MTTSNAVEVFQFPMTGQQLRVVLDDDGEPWVIAADAASALGYRDTHNATRILDEIEKGTHQMSTPGGLQSVVTVSESGLYRLIMRSNKPDALQFQMWVTREVLPSIRKTGSYALKPAEPDELEIARNYVRVIEEKRAALARAVIAEDTVFELTPKAEQADFHRAADGLVPIGDFANKLKAWAKDNHGVRVLHPEVWDFLGQIRLIIRGDKIRNNQPTAFATEKGFIRPKETEFIRDGIAQVSVSPRLTPAGEGWAWDRAVRRIAEHGSLRPTTIEKRSA